MSNAASPNIILMQPKPGENRDAISLSVWYTLAKSLKLAGITFVVADEHNWRSFLSRDTSNHLVLPSPNSLHDFYEAPNGKALDVSVVICPDHFSSWGPAQWQTNLAEEVLPQTRIFTDSEGSRRTIESAFCANRLDVRVINPDFGLLSGFEDNLTPESLLELDEHLEYGLGENTNSEWSFAGYKAVSETYELAHRNPESSWKSFEEAEYVATPPNEEDQNHRVKRLGDRLANFELDETAEEANLREAISLGRPYDIDLSGTKVGIFGTKLSFIDELSRALKQRTGASVQLDEWKYLSGPPNREQSEALLAASDVVIGEWARPNNVWIQRLARPGQRLIVRAHRYEVTTEFPRSIDMDRFDAGVVITPWVGRKLVQEFGWPASKMVYIPNYVDQDYFFRPKLPDARFTLGIVGITPSLKRIDLALDLLAALRRKDQRYILRVRGNMPHEHIKWDSDPRISRQWGETLTRLEFDPVLRGAVHFDPPARDMASWLQRIGVILSTSDVEGSHVALAEGIASGALPLARRWPGIETLWPEDFVFDSFEDAVSWVEKCNDQDWYETKTNQFRRHQSLDGNEILRAWEFLLSGDLDQAQAVFGDIDWNAPIFSPTDQRDRFV